MKKGAIASRGIPTLERCWNRYKHHENNLHRVPAVLHRGMDEITTDEDVTWYTEQEVCIRCKSHGRLARDRFDASSRASFSSSLRFHKALDRPQQWSSRTCGTSTSTLHAPQASLLGLITMPLTQKERADEVLRWQREEQGVTDYSHTMIVLPPPPPMTRFSLPGLSLPLNWTPHEAYTKYEQTGSYRDKTRAATCTNVPACGSGKNLFPNALNDVDSISCVPPPSSCEYSTNVDLVFPRWHSGREQWCRSWTKELTNRTGIRRSVISMPTCTFLSRTLRITPPGLGAS